MLVENVLTCQIKKDYKTPVQYIENSLTEYKRERNEYSASMCYADTVRRFNRVNVTVLGACPAFGGFIEN